MMSIVLRKMREMGVDTSRLTKRQLARLRQESEEVKIGLTTNEDWVVDISEYTEEDEEIVITRSEFEERIEHYIDETIRICERCITQSELKTLVRVSGLFDRIVIDMKWHVQSCYPRFIVLWYEK